MNLNEFQFIDLTHRLNADSPHWDASCGFEHLIKSDYEDWNSTIKFRIAEYTMPAGMGTHMDAPSHCFKDGMSTDELPLENLIAACVCIDVSHMADENFLLSKQHIQAFEQKHQSIEPEDLVIIHTGWSRHWSDASTYRNDYQFPSVSADAADYLLSKGVNGIGIDTLSPDCLKTSFPVHQKFLGNGKYIIENVAHSDQLPATGAFVIALPLKVEGGAESPIRLIAMINNIPH